MVPDTYEIRIGPLTRRLPICPVGDGVGIAFLDVVGDADLLEHGIRAMLPPAGTFDVILGGDTVGMLVAHQASLIARVPYVVARKKRTPDMTAPLCESAQSIAAAQPSTYYLGEDKAARLAGARVLVVDEVMSTGSTVGALTRLAQRAGAASVSVAVIATEGEPRPDVRAALHLPVFAGDRVR